LAGRIVLIAGANDLARLVARELKQRGCVLIFASRDRDAAHRLAHELKARFVQFEALYSTNHDVLIVCDEEKQPSKSPGGETGIHPGYLKSSMTVLELTDSLRKSPLLREAESRGCAVVSPQNLWLEQVSLQAHLLTGKDLPRPILAAAASWLTEEE
jgi:3-dehydroquinate dehydratase/shikimate dehydrogenase